MLLEISKERTERTGWPRDLRKTGWFARSCVAYSAFRARVLASYRNL